MRASIPSTLLLAALALLVGAVRSSAQSEDAPVDLEVRSGAGPIFYGEPVRRVYTGGLDSWRILDRRRLLFYRSRSRPFLITLRVPAPRMRFDPVIGLRLRDRSIDARFDSIYLDGFPYPIERIEKLTPDVARQLLARQQGRAEQPGAGGAADGEREEG